MTIKRKKVLASFQIIQLAVNETFLPSKFKNFNPFEHVVLILSERR